MILSQQISSTDTPFLPEEMDLAVVSDQQTGKLPHTGTATEGGNAAQGSAANSTLEQVGFSIGAIFCIALLLVAVWTMIRASTKSGASPKASASDVQGKVKLRSL